MAGVGVIASDMRVAGFLASDLYAVVVVTASYPNVFWLCVLLIYNK